MRQEVKDLYTCILCPKGYVKGLREKYSVTHPVTKTYGTIRAVDIQKMNRFIRNNMKVLKMKNKKLLIFDMDDTLTKSKSDISQEMMDLLNKILHCFSVNIAIVSGCAYEQFEQQFLKHIGDSDRYYLMPASGAELYEYSAPRWNKVYSHNLLLSEKARIHNTFEFAISHYNALVEINAFDGPEIDLETKLYGEYGEDRNGQITFSLLGQQAPLAMKKTFDPDYKIRNCIAEFMIEAMPEYEITVGGTTSIDVTKKGINKAFGVKRVIEHLGLRIDEVVFMGDALFEGGNDYPVKEMGVECIRVDNSDHTARILRSEFFGED